MKLIRQWVMWLDDLLAKGEKEVLKPFFSVRQEWTISEPDWCEEDSTLKFCGLEVGGCSKR